MAVGKISGPLLSSNLVRDGVNLAVETDLLFIDVNKSRIGVNTDSPQFDLDVNGTVRTTHLDIRKTLTLGNLTISENSITSSQDTITIAPSGNNPVVYHARVVADQLQISDNTIQSSSLTNNLKLSASGNGLVEIDANTTISGNMEVLGNLTVQGNVVVSGNIVLGNEVTDTIVIAAGFASDLSPEVPNAYSLGTSQNRWNTVFVDQIDSNNLVTDRLQVGDLLFNNNQISSPDHISIRSSAGVQIEDLYFKDSSLTNVVPDSITTIQHTGTGYLKIEGTNGVVIPVGSTEERPNYAEIGMMRYNSDLESVEVWQGVEWGTPAGRHGPVTEDRASLIAASIVLTLG